MPSDHVIELAERRCAPARWSAANRLACRAEAELAQATSRHAMGEGPSPSALLERTAILLRERANALRGQPEEPGRREPHASAQVLPFVRRR